MKLMTNLGEIQENDKIFLKFLGFLEVQFDQILDAVRVAPSLELVHTMSRR